jgi:hypothetical protein
LTGFIVALALTIAPWSAPVRAQSLGDADRAAIQSLIGSQIAAFERDDGAAAYAMASPGIQRIFPTVDAFMTMVEGGYMPVYRPRSFVFGPLVDTPHGPVQTVFITGPDGLAYVAIYSLERQADGSWKISGCTLQRDDRPTT